MEFTRSQMASFSRCEISLSSPSRREWGGSLTLITSVRAWPGLVLTVKNPLAKLTKEAPRAIGSRYGKAPGANACAYPLSRNHNVNSIPPTRTVGPRHRPSARGDSAHTFARDGTVPVKHRTIPEARFTCVVPPPESQLCKTPWFLATLYVLALHLLLVGWCV